MDNLRTLTALPAHERRLFLKALPIVAATRVGLCLLPLGRLRALLNRLADLSEAPRAHDDYAYRSARAVARASLLVPGASTLTQALATLTLLRRRGLVGRLRITLRRDARGGRQVIASVVYKHRVIIGAAEGVDHNLGSADVCGNGPTSPSGQAAARLRW